jgi:hypothetical protein
MGSVDQGLCHHIGRHASAQIAVRQRFPRQIGPPEGFVYGAGHLARGASRAGPCR